jgi:predicted RNA-binding protein (virulence factor B family)
MIHLGQKNTLEILRETDHGIYLVDEEKNEVLLPNRYVPESFKIWDKIEVFVYLDNEERPVASTDMPFVTKEEYALLRCSQVSDYSRCRPATCCTSSCRRRAAPPTWRSTT